MSYKVKETEIKEKWNTGSKRGSREGKGRFDLLPPISLMKLAQHYEVGAKVYGERNWEKGQPISRYLDSALRHINQFREGYVDEPHIVSATWNLMAIIHTLEMIERGLLPKELYDIPSYVTPKEAMVGPMSVEKSLNTRKKSK